MSSQQNLVLDKYKPRSLYTHAAQNNSTTSTMMRLPRALPGEAESLGAPSPGTKKDLSFEEPVAEQSGDGHHYCDQT